LSQRGEGERGREVLGQDREVWIHRRIRRRQKDHLDESIDQQLRGFRGTVITELQKVVDVHDNRVYVTRLVPLL
jgi:hypothetical protein